MPVSIVVGGQFGSEGKGKVAHFLAEKMEASYAVRCGGPNSGHTVIDQAGNARIFQQLPTASILPDVKLAICAGSYIDLDILFKEIKETGINSTRLIIDPNAVIITDEMKQRERKSDLIDRIGSTGSGTGAAVAARISREKEILFARNIEMLSPFIEDVPNILRASLDKKERIILEGTQGFGLSPLHSRYFPYVTSRDTTAAAFLSETGLSPLDVDDIIVTIRTFPIRVAGKSGPLPGEIDWETVTRESGRTSDICEHTSVTRQTRRVARFSQDIVKMAIYVNRPSRIFLNHLDYISESKRSSFLEEMESLIKYKIDMVGLSPMVLVESNKIKNV